MTLTAFSKLRIFSHFAIEFMLKPITIFYAANHFYCIFQHLKMCSNLQSRFPCEMFPSPDDIDPALSDVQGVEVECAEDPNCGEVTYNTCMAAYQASLGSGKKDGRSIWIDKSGVEVPVCEKKKNFLLIEQLICSVLRPDMRVLEFGSGGSTTLFSPFVKQWISIEHNTYWAETVKSKCYHSFIRFILGGKHSEKSITV